MKTYWLQKQSNLTRLIRLSSMPDIFILVLQKKSWNLKNKSTWVHPKTPWSTKSVTSSGMLHCHWQREIITKWKWKGDNSCTSNKTLGNPCYCYSMNCKYWTRLSLSPLQLHNLPRLLFALLFIYWKYWLACVITIKVIVAKFIACAIKSNKEKKNVFYQGWEVNWISSDNGAVMLTYC